MAELIAMIEEINNTDPTINPQRIYTSNDHGMTWVHSSDLIIPGAFADAVWPGKLFGNPDNGVTHYPDGNVAFGLGAFPYNGAVVGRSTDSGATWTTVGSSLVVNPATDDWTVHGVIKVSSTRYFAYGFFRFNHVSYQLLRSDDGGLSFDRDLVRDAERPLHLQLRHVRRRQPRTRRGLHTAIGEVDAPSIPSVEVCQRMRSG